jgi:hypothetical protein
MPVKHKDAPEYEYQRFGDGYVRRRADTADEWEACAPPDEVMAELEAVTARKRAAKGSRMSGGVSAKKF